MESFDKAMQVMQVLLGKDCQFALATAKDNIPSLRYVDTYWDGVCFWIVTYGKSRKAQEIARNPNATLCNIKLFSFAGKAYHAGHPLAPANLAIREKLIEEFKPWYFLHNNEADEAMCYVRLQPETGFIYADGTGYQIDFTQKTAKEFPFTFEISLPE
jgi:hypothetical protein